MRISSSKPKEIGSSLRAKLSWMTCPSRILISRKSRLKILSAKSSTVRPGRNSHNAVSIPKKTRYVNQWREAEARYLDISLPLGGKASSRFLDRKLDLFKSAVTVRGSICLGG